MLNRLETTTYDEVLAELQRPNLGSYVCLEELPKADEVKQVLSDTHEVRFLIYTDDTIYELFINCNHGVDKIDGEMQAWHDQNWDLIVIPIDATIEREGQRQREQDVLDLIDAEVTHA